MAVPTRPGIIYRALRDRRHDQPAPASGRLSHVEQQIVTSVNHAIHVVSERFVKKVEPLRAELDAARRKAIDETRPEFRRTVAESGGRTYLLRLLGPTSHAVLLVAITLGELAFNAQAFGVFGEAPWMTWLIAAAIGVGLPAVAAAFGRELRQATWTRMRAVSWTFLLAGAVVVLIGVNHVRTTYLSALQMDDDQLLRGHPALSIAYLAINVFIFVAATVISYAGHDPIRPLEAARRAVMRTEERILRLEGELRLTADTHGAIVNRLTHWGMCGLMLYRSTNRRHRPAVPAYFDDMTHPDYAPAFAGLANQPIPAEQPGAAPDPAPAAALAEAN